MNLNDILNLADIVWPDDIPDPVFMKIDDRVDAMRYANDLEDAWETYKINYDFKKKKFRRAAVYGSPISKVERWMPEKPQEKVVDNRDISHFCRYAVLFNIVTGPCLEGDWLLKRGNGVGATAIAQIGDTVYFVNSFINRYDNKYTSLPVCAFIDLYRRAG